MLRKILSVGGITLVSRATGFLRDVVLAAVLGAGGIADAFVVATRLPNHFRAVFAEGAFNAAYVPSYSRALEARGRVAANLFAGRVMTLLIASQLLLLALALAFMPALIRILAPGFAADPAKFDLAVALTRITFPYLLFITLVTQLTGSLNAERRYAAGAFAPVLLNISMVAALGAAFVFPTAAHAAAWGVAAAGVLELLLVAVAAARAGVLPAPRPYRHGEDEQRFFRAFGPAVLGSSGIQLAMFADTIIATLLPQGAPSAIYYADRIYQLPVGVIAVAGGTVLLPEMSRRLAAGDEVGARSAQERTMGMTLALALPFVAAFLVVPDLLMRALFARGAFTAADAAAAGAVLAAYALGLPALVLFRGVVASFYARSDTATPLIASFAAIGVNVALKLVLAGHLGAPGLALATSAGAWVNLGLLVLLAARRGLMHLSRPFWTLLAAAMGAAIAMALTLEAGRTPFADLARRLPAWQDEAHLALLGGAGLLAYGLVLVALLRAFGVRLAWP